MGLYPNGSKRVLPSREAHRGGGRCFAAIRTETPWNLSRMDAEQASRCPGGKAKSPDNTKGYPNRKVGGLRPRTIRTLSAQLFESFVFRLAASQKLLPSSFLDFL